MFLVECKIKNKKWHANNLNLWGQPIPKQAIRSQLCHGMKLTTVSKKQFTFCCSVLTKINAFPFQGMARSTLWNRQTTLRRERERERERDCPCLVSEGEPIDEIYYDEMHGKSYQENTVRLFQHCIFSYTERFDQQRIKILTCYALLPVVYLITGDNIWVPLRSPQPRIKIDHVSPSRRAGRAFPSAWSRVPPSWRTSHCTGFFSMGNSCVSPLANSPHVHSLTLLCVPL